MAESAPGPRDSDRTGPGPGAASPRSPRTSHLRDVAAGEESDSGSETPASGVTPSEEEKEEEEGGHQWKVGDACSAVWGGDGLLYPAHLRALDCGTGTCLVEFDGYGNTEEQALADLLPPRPGSWGVSGTPRGEGAPQVWEPPPGARRRRKGERAPCSPQRFEVVPPAPLCAAWEEEEEQEALTAMLMSWYMSGYHTGFYMGLREGRAEAAEHPLRPGHRQKKAERS